MSYQLINYNRQKLQQAVAAHQEGKLEEAEHLYREILEIEPTQLDAHNNLGALLDKMNRLAEAEESYKKAIMLKPNFAEAHFNLGTTLNRSNRSDEAVISFKKAIEYKPDYVKAYNNLGNTLNKLNRLEDAEKSYRKVIELQPDFSVVYNNLGSILKDQGRYEEAEKNFRKKISFNPDFISLKDAIENTDWELSKDLLDKMCKKKIIDTQRNVIEFIRLWSIYCRKLLSQGDIKKFIKILSKLVIIGERNQDINDLIKLFFESVDINKVLELVELEDKILIKLSYCQYKFSTEDYLSSEKLATTNIHDAENLIKSTKTEDLGWMVVRRSLALYKNKNLARENLNNLLSNLEVAR